MISWLEADSGVYNDAGVTLATNGQTVQQWNDKSASGCNVTQATSGNRATYNTTGLSGTKKAVVGSFATTNNMGLATSSGCLSLNTSNLTVYVVFANVSNADGFARLADLVGASNNQDFNQADSWNLAQNSSFSTNPNTNAMGSNGTSGTGYNLASGTCTRYGAIFNGTNLLDYLNGSLNSTHAQGAAGPFGHNSGTLGILNGVGANGGNAWTGPISFFAMYTTALGSTDRASMDTYLGGKWC